MLKIYRPTDRIVVQVDKDVVIKLAPLTLHQKTEIRSTMIESRNTTSVHEATRGIALAMKYSLKSIKGLQDSDGNEYQLKFEGDQLTDETIDDLMNIEISDKLALICSAMVSGVPSKFDGKLLEGVEILSTEKEESGKKT